MAKKSEKKTNFEEYAGYYSSQKFFKISLKDLGKGIVRPNLPEALEQIVMARAKTEDDARDGIEGLSRNINKPAILEPLAVAGYEMSNGAYRKFGEENLEGILKSTPEELLPKLIQYAPPTKKVSGEYKKTAEMHKRIFDLKSSLEHIKKGKSIDARAITNVKVILSEHYALEYSDDKAMAKFYISLIKHDEANGFALQRAGRYVAEESYRLAEKLKGKYANYLKSAFEKQEILGIYHRAFEEEYKRREKEEEIEEDIEE